MVDKIEARGSTFIRVTAARSFVRNYFRGRSL
jgi:hypothetical protein